MHPRARRAIVTPLTGVLLAVGAVITVGGLSPDQPVLAKSATRTAAPPPAAMPVPMPATTIKPITSDDKARTDKSAPGEARTKDVLPSGRATATSFWDGQTASGKPMRYRTIASPYWPLGTKVKVTYRGKSAIGVVEDFGPAEWAVAQHDIPAILDLSEKMMADLTGTRSNTVHVRFEVLEWGKGRSYRRGGTGYELAMGRG